MRSSISNLILGGCKNIHCSLFFEKPEDFQDCRCKSMTYIENGLQFHEISGIFNAFSVCFQDFCNQFHPEIGLDNSSDEHRSFFSVAYRLGSWRVRYAGC
jgi:hypothetical protein